MTLLAASIVAKLDLFAEKKHAMLRPGRDYLGASVIGHADAYCAMDVRLADQKKGSTIRAGISAPGRRAGHRLAHQIGLTVMSVDPKTGESLEFTSHHGVPRCHRRFVAIAARAMS
jgi:hypothetical protein